MKTVIAAFSLLLSCTAFSQEMEKDPVDRAAFNLKGAVKSTLERPYSESKTPQGKTTVNTGSGEVIQRDFDSLGNLVRLKYMVASGDEISPTHRDDTYTYENGRLLRIETYYTSTTYAYDDQGRISDVYEEIYPPSKPVSKANRLEADFKKVHTSYVYNNDGLLEKKMQYDGRSGNALEIHTFTYRGRQLIREEIAATDGSYTDWFDYKYDADGNLVELSCTDTEAGLMERLTYTYQEKQLVQEKWELFEAGGVNQIVYRSFANGNETSGRETDGNGEVMESHTSTYTFDEQGNWIVRRTVLLNKKVEITKRTITYYP